MLSVSGLGLVAALLAAEGTPAVGPAPESRWGGRQLALGVGEEQGFQCEARLRFSHLAIDLSLGAMPYVFSVVDATSDDMPEMKIGASARAAGSIVLFFSDELERFQSGLRLGGLWDSVFGLGVLGGYVAEVNLTRRLAIQAGAGLVYFHEGRDRINQLLRNEYGSGVQDVGALQTTVQFYGGVGLLVYLM